MYSLERPLPEIRKMGIPGSLRRGDSNGKESSRSLLDGMLPWVRGTVWFPASLTGARANGSKRISPVHGASGLQSQYLWAASMRWELKEERCFYWPGWQTLPQAVPLMGSKWGNPRERGSEGWSGATAWSVFPIILVPKCLKAVCTFCQVGTILFLIDKQNARTGSNRGWGWWATQGFPQSSSSPLSLFFHPT